MAIEAGTLVEAVTAAGDTVLMRATGAPIQGRDFPVVWLCTEAEYESDEDVKGIPWPLNAVREAGLNAVPEGDRAHAGSG